MQEQWIRWDPIIGLGGTYDIDTIIVGRNGLIITLYSCKDKGQKIEIAFKPFADAYRHTNESFRIKLPYDLSERYGSEFYSNWTFFKVRGSEYLSWLSYESCDLAKNFDFQHFCLACDDSIVDILARWEPEVKILESSESISTEQS